MNKTLLFIILITFFQQASFSQNYKIGHRQMLWVDSTRNNRQVLTELYYPADVNGNNVAVAAGNTKFATVVFGHGYQLTYTNYLWLKDSLVPKGYFVAFPRTEEELFPDHEAFGRDIAFITKIMTSGNANTVFFFYNRLNGKFAASGHSMGGGCALLSVQYSPYITTVCPFAAAETDPSAIAACGSISLPSLIIAGKQDCVTPPSTNQIPMYNAIPASCKVYIEIKNAKHCHWAANGFLCTLGEFTCGGFSTGPGGTYKNTMAFLRPWLGASLYNRQSDITAFQQQLATNTAVTSQSSCNLLYPTYFGNKMGHLQVTPGRVHSGQEVVLSFTDKITSDAILTITNSMGVIFKQINLSQGTKHVNLNTSSFHPGLYYITTQMRNYKVQSSFMVY
jgi:hypothetical protein